jgi:dTDP-glucose pyrophosphorylase/CBS domain-containing protein
VDTGIKPDGATILVTGGSGSLGQRFARNVRDRLSPEGIIGVARPPPCSTPQATLMNSIDKLAIPRGRSIRDAMQTIDQGGLGIALVVNADGALAGTVSDGDIRRALLGGANIDDSVSPYVSTCPVTVPENSDRAAVLDLMRARRLNQIPVVDSAGRLVGLHVVQEVLGGEARPNYAVVLAGGRGRRLGQLTASMPKPMLTVAGRPILERIVLHLVGSGITNIYLAVSYLADQIRNHFNDGSDFGCSIHYLEEDPENPLGTGGPLRTLRDLDSPPTDPLLVTNGDLVTSFSIRSLLDHHDRTQASMTVALRDYVHDVPFGVAQLDSNDPQIICQLVEKPRWSGLVNAGVYVLAPDILDLIPKGVDYPITDLVDACLERGDLVAGWRLVGEWHDVGRPHEFARARGEF